MPPRELLVQSEANNYSTAIASTENHDSMLWLICCMKPKCTVGHLKQDFVPLPGSAIALSSGCSASGCCTGIEESWVWTGSGGLQLLGSIGKLAESHIGYTCGHNQFAVNRSWGKTWETPRGFPETPETPLKPPM